MFFFRIDYSLASSSRGPLRPSEVRRLRPTSASTAIKCISFLFVAFGSGIADHSVPVQPKTKIVFITVFININIHVERNVFGLFLYGCHIGRHLQGQQGGGLRSAGEY